MINAQSDSAKLLIYLEKAVHNERLQEAFVTLCDGLFLKIDKGELFTGALDSPIAVESTCTRLAAAYQRMILTESLDVSDAAFNALVRFVFLGPVYRYKTIYKDYEVDLFKVNSSNKKNRPRDVKAIKKSLLLSNPSKKNLLSIRSLNKALQFSYLISVLASKYMLTEEDEALRNEAMHMLCSCGPFKLAPTMLDKLSLAWMHCSYALSDDKHKVKAAINETLRSWMYENGIKDLTSDRVKRTRPTMVIFSERLNSLHAMYRCYAPSLASLQEYFSIILVSDAKDIDQDPGPYSWADEILTFDACQPSFFGDLMVEIRARSPDIVLYPSLGMHYWTIALSTIRLAPIQVVMPGHPATTYSPAIDYMITEEGYVSDETRFSECVIKINNGSMPYIMRRDADVISAEVREHPDVINVAVPASTMKLNYRFLTLCKKISDASPKSLMFHFFPAKKDIELSYINDKIVSIIGKNAITYPIDSYNAYISNLNICDFILSPFPFGGTNSNIDALRQGLPVVCMDGAELHSHIDTEMMRRLGQPGWLSASSEEAYIAAALRLISNDAERVAVSQHHLATDVLSVLNRCERVETGLAIKLLYDNHEEITAMNKKSLHINELEAASEVCLDK